MSNTPPPPPPRPAQNGQRRSRPQPRPQPPVPAESGPNPGVLSLSRSPARPLPPKPNEEPTPSGQTPPQLPDRSNRPALPPKPRAQPQPAPASAGGAAPAQGALSLTRRGSGGKRPSLTQSPSSTPPPAAQPAAPATQPAQPKPEPVIDVVPLKPGVSASEYDIVGRHCFYNKLPAPPAFRNCPKIYPSAKLTGVRQASLIDSGSADAGGISIGEAISRMDTRMNAFSESKDFEKAIECRTQLKQLKDYEIEYKRAQEQKAANLETIRKDMHNFIATLKL